jgi:hypothetical protein
MIPMSLNIPPLVRSITGAVRSRRDGRRHPAAGMLDPPRDHRTQDRTQILPLRRQLILDARWVITVTTRLDDAETDQPLQSVGQNIRRDTLGRFDKLRETPLAANQVAHDEQRPAVAKHVERARHRAARSTRRRRCRPSPRRLLHLGILSESHLRNASD